MLSTKKKDEEICCYETDHEVDELISNGRKSADSNDVNLSEREIPQRLLS